MNDRVTLMRINDLMKRQGWALLMEFMVISLIPLLMLAFYIMFWLPLVCATFKEMGFGRMGDMFEWQLCVYRYFSGSWCGRVVGISAFVAFFIVMMFGQIFARGKRWLVVAIWLLFVGIIIFVNVTVFTYEVNWHLGETLPMQRYVDQ